MCTDDMSREELAEAYNRLAEEYARLKKEDEKKDAEIDALKYKVAELSSKLNVDGTNAGIPTSKTPIGKEKANPRNHRYNDREMSLKRRGGQKGRQKAAMKPIDNPDETEVVWHNLENPMCPHCKIELEDTGEYIVKKSFDVKIVVRETEHRFKVYKCPNCGKEFHAPVPNNLKEPAQYGDNLKALAASLYVNGSMSLGRITSFLKGATLDRVNVSEGYICKLLRQGAAALGGFRESLRKALITAPLLYWDETVIMVDSRRGCLRFYGTDRLAFYAAHEQKTLETVLSDKILTELTEDTLVMHDHNMENYNEVFKYRNAECVQHLLRDFKRVADDNHGEEWPQECIDLIRLMIEKRNNKRELGITGFTDEELDSFWKRWIEALAKGREMCNLHPRRYGTDKAANLIKRMDRFQDNYFLWLKDIDLPPSNNYAERSLRPMKVHMNNSGQFINIDRADDYAILKSYTQTCRINGVNETVALSRLFAGNPYNLDEILKAKN